MLMSIILGGTVHSVIKNTEASIAASAGIGLAVNAEEAKHLVMSCGQHVGQNQNVTTSDRVEQVKYLGTTLIYRNSIQE